MATDEPGPGREPVRLRPTWATPDPGTAQVLVRKVEARGGWRRPARYEIAYHPEGLATSPWWVRAVTSFTAIPGSTHTTDLHDLSVLVEQAWHEGEGRWTAWPVHYPAVARRADLRPLDAAERRALDDFLARQRADPVGAGRVPVRVQHLGRRERVVDGLVHALTAPERTRCGLRQPGLVDLGTTFHAGDPQACPACSAGTAV